MCLTSQLCWWYSGEQLLPLEGADSLPVIFSEQASDVALAPEPIVAEGKDDHFIQSEEQDHEAIKYVFMYTFYVWLL